MREITTYSFISSKSCDLLSLPEDDVRRKAVSLLNPLGEEYSDDAHPADFEHGDASSRRTFPGKIPPDASLKSASCFLPKSLPLTEQPEEIPALSLGLYGEGEDFFSLKGIVEMLLDPLPDGRFLRPRRRALSASRTSGGDPL